MIKKIALIILGLMLLPLYPFTKLLSLWMKAAQQNLSEKMRINERVIVVIREGNKKRILN